LLEAVVAVDMTEDTIVDTINAINVMTSALDQPPVHTGEAAWVSAERCRVGLPADTKRRRKVMSAVTMSTRMHLSK
jgi:hypothetical protein